ncbi:MAG: dehypoxanthine futalosine cyclase [Candidatus Cloacimonadota bacterium]|nr:MAG: dehypoxanthine futalosine cyclase [Candidatus Cloacimonadota bacterium]PIE78015.1 MAG: dehypoxanthine futalosine cyclase [Candidatus Delongbacteria bacterium]
MRNLDSIKNKVLDGIRISKEEAIEIYNGLNLTEIGILANSVRLRKHPNKNVTYIIDRNINYTNICLAKCKFCAFYRDDEKKEGRYLLSHEEIGKKIEETLDLGGVQILLQGGLHPNLGLSFYKDLFTFIKKNYNIWIHALSPPEIIHIQRFENKPLEYIIKELMSYGLDSIPGGGAEILSDRVRGLMSDYKCSSEEWLKVMEVAHKLGLRTTATMMFGSIETIEERFDHLQSLRDLQDKTLGFTAFIPWSFQPDNTKIKALYPDIEKATPYQYLKMLAISRIFLDNFDNIQVSWVTQGSKIAQIALAYGGNDFGSLMIEENVVRSAGVNFKMDLEELEYIISSAGYKPVQREMIY